jgi:hypothetical protein
LTNGFAHLWIQNKNHTWKNVVDGIPITPITDSISLLGFHPNEQYILQWWDPYNTDPLLQIIRSETLSAQTDGTIIISVQNLTTDLGVKIYQPQIVYFPLVNK